MWNIVGIEAFLMTTFIYLTGQFELLCDSIRNASQRVTYRLNQRQLASAGGDDINELHDFMSDKEKKNRYSNGNTESSIIPAMGENAHPFKSDSATSAEDGNLANLSRRPSRQQESMMVEFRIKYGSSADETRSLSNPCTTSDHQLEMEQYLMECIKYHQRLIEFSENLNLLWQTVLFVQFVTGSLLICLIGLQAISMPLDGDFAKMMGYLTSVVFLLGLYCTLGSNLMTQVSMMWHKGLGTSAIWRRVVCYLSPKWHAVPFQKNIVLIFTAVSSLNPRKRQYKCSSFVDYIYYIYLFPNNINVYACIHVSEDVKVAHEWRNTPRNSQKLLRECMLCDAIL
ncbi:uncharacterized protein LOC117282825 [Cryptotermes secundus]|uniref:uncharacterized protein LOC117282825 n=1 Tax=Cryptotermes secundus TaxID=105785 RepID=UPI001454BF94|nr:uncharacterized protein LOC117282825 [Cryptotermes secundus]